MKNLFVLTFLFSTIFSKAQNISPEILSRNNNYFTWQLFKETYKNNKEKNTFISTYGMHNLLMMLYTGAEGETLKSFEKVLKLPNNQKNSILPNLKAWTSKHKSQEPKFENENFAWIQKSFSPRPEFINDLQKYFGSELKTIDFTNKKESVNKINSFFAKKTAGKIKKILSENDVNELTKLVLNNYNNFLASWDEPFKKAENKIAGFQNNFKTYVDTEFMQDTRRVRYSETRDLQMIELPYKKALGSNEFVMQIILPKNINNYQFLLKKIQNSQYIYWESMMSFEEVFISLPKWEIKQNLNLNLTLTNLGLGQIFNPIKANFKSIADSLYVGQVLQNNYISVNENGTEAKAVSTAVNVLGGANVVKPKPKYFIAKQPFIYLIKNKSDDTILFVGVLEEVQGKKTSKPKTDDIDNILEGNNTAPKVKLRESRNPITTKKIQPKKIDKPRPIKLTKTAEEYYKSGKEKRQAKDYEGALDDFKKAIALDSKFMQAYAEMGYTYANMKQYDKALEAYNKALELGYENRILYLNRGWAKYNLDKNLDYCSDWEKSIELGYPAAQKAIDEKCK